MQNNSKSTRKALYAYRKAYSEANTRKTEYGSVCSTMHYYAQENQEKG